MSVPLVERYAIEGDRAAVGRVEFVEEVDDGAFACAAEAYEGCGFAWFDVHGEIADGVGAVGVGEFDVGEMERAVNGGGFVGAGAFDIVVVFEDAEEAFGVDECVVEVVVDAVELTDGCADVVEEQDVIHDFADGHARIVDEDEVGGEDDDEDGAYLLDESFEAFEEEGDAAGLHLLSGRVVLEASLSVGFKGFAVEGFDDGDALDDVHNAVVESLMCAEDATTPTFHAGTLTSGYEEIYRDDGECDEADVDVGYEHEDQSHDGAGEEREDVDEEVLDGVAKAHDAAVDTSLEFAWFVAFGGEESHAELEDAVDHAEREVATYVDADFFAKDALAEGEESGEEFFAEKDGADDEKKACGGGPLEMRLMEEVVDGVDGAVEHDGVDLSHERAGEGEHQCGEKKPAVGQDKWEELAEKASDAHFGGGVGRVVSCHGWRRCGIGREGRSGRCRLGFGYRP